jgi:hypothetical protein
MARCAYWMGLNEEMTNKLRAAMPCLGIIDAVTKRPPGETSFGKAVMCGEGLFCLNCCEMLERLGRGWNMHTFSSYCALQIKAHAYLMDSGRTDAIFTPTRSPHTCGAACKLR